MARAGPALVLLAVLAAAPAGTVLVVADADTGERLLAVPVEQGQRVTLAYTHSVERTPVEDVYAVDGTALDNVAMRFQSYGWGLPAGADVRRSDGFLMFDPDRRYERLHVSPGPTAGHELLVGDRRYDLVALSGGATVRLTVERRSALGALFPP